MDSKPSSPSSNELSGNGSSGEPLERRDFFRIDDQVVLRYKMVDHEAALSREVPAEFGADLGYALLRELASIDQEHAGMLRTISDNNRDIALYFKAINKKLDLIAGVIASRMQVNPDNKPQQVSLSEGGIAFHSPVALKNEKHSRQSMSTNSKSD